MTRSSPSSPCSSSPSSSPLAAANQNTFSTLASSAQREMTNIGRIASHGPIHNHAHAHAHAHQKMYSNIKKHSNHAAGYYPYSFLPNLRLLSASLSLSTSSLSLSSMCRMVFLSMYFCTLFFLLRSWGMSPSNSSSSSSSSSSTFSTFSMYSTTQLEDQIYGFHDDANTGKHIRSAARPGAGPLRRHGHFLYLTGMHALGINQDQNILSSSSMTNSIDRDDGSDGDGELMLGQDATDDATNTYDDNDADTDADADTDPDGENNHQVEDHGYHHEENEEMEHNDNFILLQQIIHDAFSEMDEITSLSQLYHHISPPASSSSSSSSPPSSSTSKVPIWLDLDAPQGKAFHWILHHDTYAEKSLWKNLYWVQREESSIARLRHKEVKISIRTRLLQRYIITVLFFSTKGEYNVNFARRFTPSSNVHAIWTARGSIQFLSDADVCDWNVKLTTTRKKEPATSSRSKNRNESSPLSSFGFLGLRKRGGGRQEEFGVLCKDGFVTDLNLHGLGMNGGSIPAEIGLLSNLEKLDLSGNYLTGTIPNSIGGTVGGRRGRDERYKLEARERSGGGREGRDDELSFVVLNEHLVYLDLSENILVGPIPDTLGSLENLESLYLHSNYIHGDTVPPAICKRSKAHDFAPIELSADCDRDEVVFCDCCTYCGT